jgi:hypothetical protein
MFSRAVEEHGLYGLPPRCSPLPVPTCREIKIRLRSLDYLEHRGGYMPARLTIEFNFDDP